MKDFTFENIKTIISNEENFMQR